MHNNNNNNEFEFESSQFSSHNNTQIESITNNCLKSRIRHEYKELSKIYVNNAANNNDDSIVLFYDTQTNTIKITINDKLNETINNEYTFIVDSNYPFESPLFHFNKQPYSHYLRLPSQRFSEHLKKFTSKTCLCCSSLSCKYNWSPAVKLTMFIDELNKIRQYKRNIVYKILSDKIKDKYLIDDVQLDSFLFPIVL
jgi:hypothetical protein